MAALMTGNFNFDWVDSEPGPLQRSKVCVPYLCADLLLRGDPSKYVGVAIYCLSFAADILSPSEFRDLLASTFRITTTRQTTRMNRARAVCAQALV